MKFAKLILLTIFFTLVTVQSSRAQSGVDLLTGFRPFGTYQQGDIDSIDLSNGKPIIEIPLISYPQRGGKLQETFVLRYHNTGQIQGGQPGCFPSIFGGPCIVFPYDSGFAGIIQKGLATASYSCTGGPPFNYSCAVQVLDSDGSSHPMSAIAPTTFRAADGTGYLLQMPSSFPALSNGVTTNFAHTITDPNGISYSTSSDLSTTTIEDTNGNKIVNNTDTLGRVITPSLGFPVTLNAWPTGNGTYGTSDYSGCSGPLPIVGAVSWTPPGLNGGTYPLKFCFISIIELMPPAPFSGSQGFLPTNVIQLQSIVLPDTSTWTFLYDATGNGDLLQIINPQGGSTTYVWTNPVGSQALIPTAIATRTLDPHDGTPPAIWQYQYNRVFGQDFPVVTTVTDPTGADSVHTFGAMTNGVVHYLETKTQFYKTSVAASLLLKTISTDYQAVVAKSKSVVPIGQTVVPVRVTTIWPNGQQSKIEKDYDAGFPSQDLTYDTNANWTGACSTCGSSLYGQIVATREYGLTSTTSFPLLRTTTTPRWTSTHSNYLINNLLNLVSSSTITDSANNIASSITFAYDEPTATLAPSGITAQHDVNLPAGWVRGNLTSVSRFLNTTGGSIVSHSNWYDTGQPYQEIDPIGHVTTHTYDPFYAGGYMTSTCNAKSQCVSATYDFNTGLMTSFTDENASFQSSGNSQGDPAYTASYSYDSLLRLTLKQSPPDATNGGLRPYTQINYSLPGTFPYTVQEVTSITSGISSLQTTIYDGLRRPTHVQHSTPNGPAIVDTKYDGLNRIIAVSNPYFSISDSTYGVRKMSYDIFNRVTDTTEQDGSITHAVYNDPTTVTTSDESGNQIRRTRDAFGRLAEVDEPGGTKSSGVQASASISISGPLQSTWVAPGTPHLAAVATALSSVTMSDGSSHNFYFDTNYHLCHLWGTTGSSWDTQDLSDQTGSVPALAGSALTTVFQLGTIHVFYQGANQHLYDLEWTGTGWLNLDLTTLTGATAISGTKLSAVVQGPNSPELFYEGTNQHFYMVYWVASSSVWSNADMSSITGQTTLMATNSSVSSGIYGSGFYGFYLGTNQHLITIYWSGSAWATADVTALSGGALATSGSALTTLSIGAGSTPMMTFYEGASQHIYSIYWTTTSVWQTLDFTSFSGATNVAAAATSLTNSNPSIQAFYFGSNQHLDDINWNGSAWVNSDLTSLSGATVTAATGSSLSGHGTSGGNTSNIFFEGANQHIYHTYYNPSTSSWLNEDLLTAASNYVLDSGTVSLTIPNIPTNFTATVCYGVSTNPFCAGKPINSSSSDIINAFMAVLNGAGSPVNASLNGGILVLTWRTQGSITASVDPINSSSDNPGLFPSGSFTSTEGTFGGGAAPGSQFLTTPLITLYTYDVLGNLTCVEQHGDASTGTGCSAPPASDATSPWRIRRFTYDSLSRLLSAKNPESGTISYIYDADGNLLQKTSPAPNQTGSATQTISYCYDELHRVTGKGYGVQSCPLSSAVVGYAYDSGTNAKGNLVSLFDQAGTGSYTYDALGRLSTETRTLTGAGGSAISKNLSYEYNLDGSLKTLHYPSGAAVTYTPDSAGRILSAVDSGNNISYATGATYGPDGAVTGFISGYSSSFAGITNAFAYNKRLQPLTMSATAPSQTVYSIGYDFHAGNGTAGTGLDNGNILGFTNYKDATQSQSFAYDSLNRVTSAQNAGTDCNAATVNGKTKFWGNNYGYDAWGNLLQKSVTKCGAEYLNLTASVNNQLSGYGFDAAGNTIYDATTSLSYTFDQENRLIGAGGYTYTYDGDGNRVRKSNGTLASNGTLYWVMTPGVVAETDLAGTTKSEYVFFDGKRVARRDGVNGAGGVFYYFSDHLKTASVITDSAGVIKAESDYYPWGGELQLVNNDTNDYKFTGQKRDSESSIDYFNARYYSSSLGRFMSADEPFADQHSNNPQTWNLYVYSRNNPSTFTDPSGRCTEDSPGHFSCNYHFPEYEKDRIIGRNKARHNALNDFFMIWATNWSTGAPIGHQFPSNSIQRHAMIAESGKLSMVGFGMMFSIPEQATVDILEAEGATVEQLEIISGQRNADALVNGVRTELKNMDSGATSATVRNEVNDSIRRGGQARNIIINSRGSGLSEAEATRGLNRVGGITRGKVDSVRIIGDGFDMTRKY